jgi:hypothetical protein
VGVWEGIGVNVGVCVGVNVGGTGVWVAIDVGVNWKAREASFGGMRQPASNAASNAKMAPGYGDVGMG